MSGPAVPAEVTAYPIPEVVECPFPFYAMLRDGSPVHRLADGNFLVTRWEDIAAVARKPDLYSNAIGIAGVHGDFGLDPDEGRFTPFQMPFSDPPEHRLKRSLGQLLVTRERMRTYEPLVRRLVDELIDDIVHVGTADLKSVLADRLPKRVISAIFGVTLDLPTASSSALSTPSGVPKVEGEATVGIGPGRLAASGVGLRTASPDERERASRSAAERARFFRQAILDRVGQPTDDFISVCTQAKLARDGELDLAYLTVEVMNMYNAGIGTSAHMIASAFLLLLQHPEECARVRADPSLASRVVNEALRLESPVQWLQRRAMADTVIGGVPVPSGSVLFLLWASGNRDERHFAEPERFWLDRPGMTDDQLSGMLAFGHGIHLCVGAPIARLEGRIAIEQVLQRLPGLRLAEGAPPPHLFDANHRAPARLPVVWDRP